LADFNDVRLPFDTRKQIAVLGHLLTNEKFHRIAGSKIQPGWFNDPRAGKVYLIQRKFVQKHGRQPTIDELRSCPDIMAEPTLSEKNSLLGIIQSAQLETSNFGLDAIRTELTHWYASRLFTEGVSKSVETYNRGKFEEAYTYIWERIGEVRNASFDEDSKVDFLNFETYLNVAEEQYGDALTTGLTILDDALVPDGASQGRGGLFKGDTTILLAPSNVGKTSTCITVIAHNIKRCKYVGFMTHEGRPSDIREKVLQSITGWTKPQLFEKYKTEEGRQILSMATSHLDKYLTYIPYNKAGMVVEDVLPVIRREQEKNISKNGQGLDMFVSDYPAKLSTNKANGGHLQQRHIEAIVYENYVQLALELNLHVLAPIQTNRSGSIANRDDARILTMEDVAESWGVMTAATNVITLNRDLVAALNNRMAFHIGKSRSSEVGRTIVARTKFNSCITHSDVLGGTWYRGSGNMSDRIEELMIKHNGGAIPDEPGHQ
jgi:replicative DNA helicase